MKNFDVVREIEEQRGDEWVYGAVATDLAAVPLNFRTQYLPTGVLQFNNIMDTNGCASRGPLNILETKLDYFWDNGMHPAIKQWCTDNGYRVNGKFALCDAFIEILSGTRSNGNSLKAPVEAVRAYGVIPAYLIPLEDGMTFDQYMNPARVTAAHKKLGAEFLRRITLNYEQVPVARFSEAVEADLLDVALHGYGPLINGMYYPTDEQINHVVARFTNEIDVFDNYESFIKRLDKGYKFFDWGYSLSITAQNPAPEEVLTVWQTLLKFNLQSFFPSFLAFFTKITPPPMATTIAIEQPPAPKYLWDTPLQAKHSVRVICDEEGFTLEQKNTMCATIAVESGFHIDAINHNTSNGRITSTDNGICQWNDFYHATEITPNEALNNPEKAVRLMCQYWKRNQRDLWIAYRSGAYKKYL